MTNSSRTVAIIGAGVIGGGWAARFLLHGWDVRIFDPGADVERQADEILDNARRSLPGLYDVPLPDEGELSWCDSIASAVEAADWIQESVPERLDAKHAAIRAIHAASRPDAILASSTSGFRPSELSPAGDDVPLVVAHPYNPVYLLPLVELVPHAKTATAVVERAEILLSSVGMKSVRLKKEIDAHIGDRLLESLWREALWLVKDDYATTAEIDDIIRFSFGIRWAQMGLFETYRIAGGEAGMKHFIAQFAPALGWPWSRLTDVPELDDDLTEKIAAQSDEQSGRYSIRELEGKRDANLVALMRALKGQRWGVGEFLNRFDRNLAQSETDVVEPIVSFEVVAPSSWCDPHGFVLETAYRHLVDQALDKFLTTVGCDDDYQRTGFGFWVTDTTIRRTDDARVGKTLRVVSRAIERVDQKIHVVCEIVVGARVIATDERSLAHVHLATREIAELPDTLRLTLDAAVRRHRRLPRGD